MAIKIFGLVVMVAMIVITEGFLHYFPWRLILKGRDLPRPPAYVFGVSAIAIPLSAWLLWFGYIESVVVLWVAIVSAGLVVMVLYLFDYVIELMWRDKEARERENHAKKG